MRTTNASLEERVTILERELRKVTSELRAVSQEPQLPWWEYLAGKFKNDALFEKVIEAGHAYRRSLTPRPR